jgi:hypothetical protein
MYKRLTTIVILAATLAGLSAIPATAERSCGTLREGGRGQTLRVTVGLGRVSCSKARGVINMWFSPGHPTENGGMHAGLCCKSWTMSDGWTCQPSTGGVGRCAIGGSGRLRFTRAREVIGWAPTIT